MSRHDVDEAIGHSDRTNEPRAPEGAPSTWRSGHRRRQRPISRSRWAAIGAAVAVSLGAGGLGLARAASETPSGFVSITPARVLDTRTGLGLPGPLVSPSPQTLQITGPIARPGGTTGVVVPPGASAVVLNVTAVEPEAGGFLSVRPDGTPGPPETSNLNFAAGTTIPNAVTVALPAGGAIELTYDAFGTPGPTVGVLVDVTGYYVPGGGTGGANGPQGPPGPAGPKGATGPKGPPGVEPARVVWVAASGDGTFPTLSAALASITDNSSNRPYVIKIAPGVYTETAPITLKDHVDIEGSGDRVTTIRCACGSEDFDGPGVLNAGNINAQVRHLTVENTGSGQYGFGITTSAVVGGRFSLLHVTARASGALFSNIGIVNRNGSTASLTHVTAVGTGQSNTASAGVENSSSSPTMRQVTASGEGGFIAFGVTNISSAPDMFEVTARASSATDNYAVYNQDSSPQINNLDAEASGGVTSYGVYSFNSGVVTIRWSAISGSIAIRAEGVGVTTLVADSTLIGPADGSGGFTCVGVHDQSFEALDTTCQ